MTWKKGQSGNPSKIFTSTNQPKKRGRKGKTTTEYLRDLSQAQSIEFSLKVIKKNGM